MSSGGMIWSAISTISTARPRSCRFSAISRPMYPAPITTTCLRLSGLEAIASTLALISSMSSMLRRTWMSGWSRPGSGGRNGEDPGHSARESQVSVYSSPVIRSRAVTVWATGSMAVTSVVIRTSMSRVSRRLCGVCRSSRERSLIVSPMWYGSPQLANETLPDFSNTMISANSSRRRARAATDAPAATPPTTTSFMTTPVLVPWFDGSGPRRGLPAPRGACAQCVRAPSSWRS